MSDIDRTIIYTFRMDDNVTDVSRRASESAKESDAEVKKAISGQTEYRTEIARTDTALDSQKVKLASQVAVLMGFKGAVSGVISGVTQLGIVSDETAVKLQMVNAAFNVMGGLATGVKTLQLAMTGLNIASMKNALINTYNAVISNPGAIALAGIGIGAAAGALTYFGLNSSNTSNTTTTTITVNAPASSGSEQAVSEIYSIVNGGAL